MMVKRMIIRERVVVVRAEVVVRRTIRDAVVATMVPVVGHRLVVVHVVETVEVVAMEEEMADATVEPGLATIKATTKDHSTDLPVTLATTDPRDHSSSMRIMISSLLTSRYNFIFI